MVENRIIQTEELVNKCPLYKCVGGDSVTKCDTYQSDFVLKI